MARKKTKTPKRKLTAAELRVARSKAGKKSHAGRGGHEWDSRAASIAGKKGAAARAAKKAARTTPLSPIDLGDTGDALMDAAPAHTD